MRFAQGMTARSDMDGTVDWEAVVAAQIAHMKREADS